jgi:hypothetical protein
MMAVLKRIGIMSAAKIQAIIMAAIGLIAGVLYAIMMSLLGGIMAASGSSSGGGIMAGLGFASIIVFPILYGALGFVFGALGAWLYNLVAGWVGGLEVDLS